MDWFTYIFTFLFTYILSSQFVFLMLIQAFPQSERSDFFALFFLSLGLGPVIIAFVTKILVDYFPYHSKYLYVISVFGFFLIIFLVGIKQIGQLREIYIALYNRIKHIGFSDDKLKLAMLTIIVGIYGLIYVQASALPIIGADPVKFVYYANSTIEERTNTAENVTQNRPDRAKSLRGIKAKHYPTTGLYLWFFLTNTSPKADLLCRTVTAFYYLFLMILIGYSLWPRGNWTVLWGVLLFLFVPYLVSQTIGNSQDPGNLYLLMLTLTWLAEAIGRKKIIYFIVWTLILFLAVLSARINYLLIYFCFASAIVLTILRLKKHRLVLWVLVCSLLAVFLTVDFLNIASQKKKEPKVIKNVLQAANNYKANRDILNDINKYKDNYYLQLLIKKANVFTNLFNEVHFNYHFFLAIVAIFFWLFHKRDKTAIEIILMTSVFSYLFLITFHDSSLFHFSKVYRAKMSVNEFFLVYIRYLLPVIVMLVVFNAIFASQMTAKLTGRFSRPIVVMLVLSFLFFPVMGRLLNKKQSLGLDEWVKIFTASEEEKLFSYRGDYGKIIKFIKTNVAGGDKILTPTKFKFIPYYSSRQCIDINELDKSDLKKNPERTYRNLRARGINYILPTDKFRVFSYLKPRIDDVLNHPSLTYIVYDSPRWRLYKLRNKIKPFNEMPLEIPNGTFSAADGNKPRNWNCSIPENENWGLINSEGVSRTVLLKNVRGKKMRLYTGDGGYKLPPSHFNDDRYQINASTYYKLHWSAKASRPIQLKVWFFEYDHSGNMTRNLTKIMLATNFKEKSTLFYSGENTKEYRILFQLTDVAELYLKDITLSELIPVT